MIRSLILALSCAFACGKDKPKEDTKADPAHTYVEVAGRLKTMLDNGWVVSRWPDGSAADQGDSLLFTGIAMGVLSCDDGAPLELALSTMLKERHGVPYRHPTIQDDYSLDGLLGLWWGISRRTARCPSTKELWAGLLPEHAKAVSIEPFFSTALQQVMADLGTASPPSVGERGRLGSEVSSWATLVVAQRAAGYRLHLGWLALELVDSPKGKVGFCEAVKDAQIALVEQFCGRPGLNAWVNNFAFNRYVYQFQRAAWEGPDGSPSLETPAVDLLVALSVLYPIGTSN